MKIGLHRKVTAADRTNMMSAFWDGGLTGGTISDFPHTEEKPLNEKVSGW